MRSLRLVDASGANRLVSLAAAIIAVLAALGTLFSHHRSIAALSVKNQAILTQARATDTYNAYEAKQIRYNIYRARLASEAVRNAGNRAELEAIAHEEQTSSPALLQKAQRLEAQAMTDETASQTILKSYETLQTATAIFEISIVLVSISALASARLFLPAGCILSGVGIVLLIAGLIQGH
jgi:hypothetical protein